MFPDDFEFGKGEEVIAFNWLANLPSKPRIYIATNAQDRSGFDGYMTTLGFPRKYPIQVKTRRIPFSKYEDIGLEYCSIGDLYIDPIDGGKCRGAGWFFTYPEEIMILYRFPLDSTYVIFTLEGLDNDKRHSMLSNLINDGFPRKPDDWRNDGYRTWSIYVPPDVIEEYSHCIVVKDKNRQSGLWELGRC